MTDNTEAVVPWYKKWQYYAVGAIVVLIVVLAVVLTLEFDNSSPSKFTAAPSMVPSTSFAPSFSPVYIVLKDFYESTSGDNWDDNTNWLNYTLSWCDWYGITCEENSDSIKEVIFQANNLQGSFPSSISSLSNLELIELFNDTMTGTIPSEVGLLSSLKYLLLDRNSFTGKIPSEVGLLSSLEYLQFHFNSMTGSIPSEVGLLSNLEMFVLENNLFTGTVPTEVCNLIDSGSLSVILDGTNITNNC